jgi:Leucine-rich repeat (LRR) protein
MHGRFGLDRCAIADSLGSFVFDGVPPAENVTIRIIAGDPAVSSEKVSTPVLSETTVLLDPLELTAHIDPADSANTARILSVNQRMDLSVYDIVRLRNNRVVSLDLTGLDLYFLPVDIVALPYLEELLCKDNNIAEIPDSLDRCSSLRRLVLAKNLFTTIPDVVWRCTTLTLLDMSYNAIPDTLPEQIGMLRNLDTLYMGFNRLTALSPSLGSCTRLKVLTVDQNQLSSIPAVLGECTNIEKFVANWNEIEVFPDAVTNWTKCEYLILHFNKITRLPESFGDMVSLRKVNLSNNNLENLPLSKEQMNTIEHIGLNGNGLCDITPEVEQWLEEKGANWDRNRSCE